jgi:hypothetical protein
VANRRKYFTTWWRVNAFKMESVLCKDIRGGNRKKKWVLAMNKEEIATHWFFFNKYAANSVRSSVQHEKDTMRSWVQLLGVLAAQGYLWVSLWKSPAKTGVHLRLCSSSERFCTSDWPTEGLGSLKAR